MRTALLGGDCTSLFAGSLVSLIVVSGETAASSVTDLYASFCPAHSEGRISVVFPDRALWNSSVTRRLSLSWEMIGSNEYFSSCCEDGGPKLHCANPATLLKPKNNVVITMKGRMCFCLVICRTRTGKNF